MKSYTILNLTTLEIVEFKSEPRRWLAELEDVLYVQWELSPYRSREMWGLLAGDHLIFSYHQVEFVEVWLEPNTGRVLLKDLPAGWGL
jgi:hypothetical protein